MENNQNQTAVLSGDALQDFFNNPESALEQEAPKVELPIAEFFGEEPPAIQEPEKVVIPTPAPVQQVKTNQYIDQAKFLIEKGYWKDLDVEIEENGEKKTVPISELEITPELFEQLDEAQKKEQKEEFASKYIDAEGVDETTKKLIELKKKGGDISELIQMDAEFVNPIKNLDLDSQEVQEYLVRQKYQSLGWKPNHIELEIAELKENLTLDSEALKIAEEVNSNFDKVVESKLQERTEAVEKQIAEQKVFQKSISSAYKDLNLKESLVKSLVENTAKFDEYGLANVDKVFFELKKDPEKFARIAFHILDEEGFNEFQGVKVKNKVTSEQVRKVITLTPRTATSKEVRGGEDKLKEFFQEK